MGSQCSDLCCLSALETSVGEGRLNKYGEGEFIFPLHCVTHTLRLLLTPIGVGQYVPIFSLLQQIAWGMGE